MLARLFALFLIVPVVELALLIRVGNVIGFWPTIAIVVGTAFAGSYLAKREGLSAWRRLQESLHRGDLPGEELLDGVIILVAATLLVTPGVLSDLTGIVGLLPFTRVRLRAFAMRRIRRAMEKGTLRMGFDVPDAPFPPPAGGPAAAPPAWSGEARPTPRHREQEPPGLSEG